MPIRAGAVTLSIMGSEQKFAENMIALVSAAEPRERGGIAEEHVRPGGNADGRGRLFARRVAVDAVTE
jgi:hypothetical protein